MNVTEMRTDLNNKLTDFQVCEFGLSEIMKRLITIDSQTGQRYLQMDDMDQKIKNAFDLVIFIASNTKITVLSVENIKEFIFVYDEIIQKYDKTNKQIYALKLGEALNNAIEGVHKKEDLKNKMNILN